MVCFFVVFVIDQLGMCDVCDCMWLIYWIYLCLVVEYGVYVWFGGLMLDLQDDVMNGMLFVVEVDDIYVVMQFIGNDLYVKEGLFLCVEVCLWDWSFGNFEYRV